MEGGGEMSPQTLAAGSPEINLHRECNLANSFSHAPTHQNTLMVTPSCPSQLSMGLSNDSGLV